MPTDASFQPERFTDIPTPAQRYLAHAIAPNTPLATAVWLKMHGEIRLKNWQPFQAEQVICQRQGMIWQATVWMNGLPILGWDRLVNENGAMRWKLLGLFPVVTAEGRNITRSAVGRLHGESMWLPSLFCNQDVAWTAPDASHIHIKLGQLGETTDLVLAIDSTGKMTQLAFKRWGNPAGAEYYYEYFGAYLEKEETFSGYTIPTQVRAGWYFGSDRFEAEGEFFRAFIDEANYR